MSLQFCLSIKWRKISFSSFKFLSRYLVYSKHVKGLPEHSHLARATLLCGMTRSQGVFPLLTELLTCWMHREACICLGCLSTVYWDSLLAMAVWPLLSLERQLGFYRHKKCPVKKTCYCAVWRHLLDIVVWHSQW